MDYENGYIFLHRKSLFSQVFQDESLWKLWTWCLLKASYKERWVSMKSGKGTVQVKIMPGQFIYGRESAAKELKCTPSTIRNRMEKLKNIGNLDIEKDSKYSIISIINWDTYQSRENPEDSEEDSQRTAKGQPKDTNNKGNNSNKGKKENSYSSDFLSFWEAYPKKSGSKAQAFEYWKRLNGGRPSLEIILTAIESQLEWRRNSRGKFRPEWKDPERWIKNKMWEAETDESGDSLFDENEDIPSCVVR